MDAVADIARLAIGAPIALAGLVCMLAGAIGLLRFPDLYTRLHAARVSDGIGPVLVLVGLAVLSEDFTIAVRLLLLAALIAAMAPALSHLAANAAHTGGLTPIAGKYTAPRPGARRADS